MKDKQDDIELSIIKVKKRRSNKERKSPISKSYSNYLKNKKSDNHKKKGTDIVDIKINVIKKNETSDITKKPEKKKEPEKKEPEKKKEPVITKKPEKKKEPMDKKEPEKKEPVITKKPEKKTEPEKKENEKKKEFMVKKEPVITKKPEKKKNYKKRVSRRSSRSQIRIKKQSSSRSNRKNRITRTSNRVSKKRRANNKSRRVSFRCYPQNKKKNLDKVIEANEGSKRFQEQHGKKDVSTRGGINGSGITKATGGETVGMVKERINKERQYVNQIIPDEKRINIPQNVQDSAVSLIFNVGQSAFKNSKAYQNLLDGDIQGYYREAFDPQQGFTKITGTDGTKQIDEGLVNRRRQELELAQNLWKAPE